MIKIPTIVTATIMALGIIFSSISYATPVWIDVRTLAENKVDNIEGDMLISHLVIVEQVNNIYPDKNTDIHLYCRSGNRAGQALNALNLAGYNNVKNIGSIKQAREARGIAE